MRFLLVLGLALVASAAASSLRGAASAAAQRHRDWAPTPLVHLTLRNATDPHAGGDALMRLYVEGSTMQHQPVGQAAMEWKVVSGIYTLVVTPGEAERFAFAVSVGNEMSTASLMHWHGLTPPTSEDGVPLISANAVQPGDVAGYYFLESGRGTFWVHSHWAWQNAEGLSAPIIIEDAPSTTIAQGLVGVRDVMAMLADRHYRQVCEFDALIYPEWCSPQGPESRVAVGNSFDPDYRFYFNRREFHEPHVESVAPGERVRLRALHAGTMTQWVLMLDARFPAAEVLATDGYATARGTALPRTDAAWGNTQAEGVMQYVPLAQAQRVDVLLTAPQRPGYYAVYGRQLHAGHVYQVAMWLRVGNVEGPPPAIAPKAPASLAVPAFATAQHAFDATLHASPSNALDNTRPVDRKLEVSLRGEFLWFPEFAISATDEMDSWFLLQEHAFQRFDKDGITPIETLDIDMHGGLPPDAVQLAPQQGYVDHWTPAQRKAAPLVSDDGAAYDRRVRWGEGHHNAVPCEVCMRCLHAPFEEFGGENGPLGEWCRAQTDRYLFGYGLFGYASVTQTLAVACSAWTDSAKVTELGDCASWRLSDKPVAQTNKKPLRMCQGERVELTITNAVTPRGDGAEGHPIHLHGVTSQLVSVTDLVETGKGKEKALRTTAMPNGARRDTFWVPQGGSVTVRFDAENPGQWMMHCHIDDHAESGMMASIEYYDPDSPQCAHVRARDAAGSGYSQPAGSRFAFGPGRRSKHERRRQLQDGSTFLHVLDRLFRG